MVSFRSWLIRPKATLTSPPEIWLVKGLKRSVCWTHAVAFREMRIAQILAFVQNAKRVLSSDDVLHTLINRKCG
jgi:hypothetical protein